MPAAGVTCRLTEPLSDTHSTNGRTENLLARPCSIIHISVADALYITLEPVTTFLNSPSLFMLTPFRERTEVFEMYMYYCTFSFST